MRARDFVATSNRPAIRPTSDPLPVTMRAALHDVDQALRAEFPDVFARVDALLADPARGRVHELWVRPDFAEWEMRECAWCGDDFGAYIKRGAECCSRSCASSFMAWKRRRSA